MKSHLAVVLLFISLGCSEKVPEKYEWLVVSKQGSTQFTYLDPKALNDSEFMGVFLAYLTKSGERTEILIFDNKNAVPWAYPMSDTAMLHWKARFNYNPRTSLEEFVLIEVTDKTTSPPKLKETFSPFRRK